MARVTRSAVRNGQAPPPGEIALPPPRRGRRGGRKDPVNPTSGTDTGPGTDTSVAGADGDNVAAPTTVGSEEPSVPPTQQTQGATTTEQHEAGSGQNSDTETTSAARPPKSAQQTQDGTTTEQQSVDSGQNNHAETTSAAQTETTSAPQIETTSAQSESTPAPPPESAQGTKQKRQNDNDDGAPPSQRPRLDNDTERPNAQQQQPARTPCQELEEKLAAWLEQERQSTAPFTPVPMREMMQQDHAFLAIASVSEAVVRAGGARFALLDHAGAIGNDLIQTVVRPTEDVLYVVARPPDGMDGFRGGHLALYVVRADDTAPTTAAEATGSVRRFRVECYDSDPNLRRSAGEPAFFRAGRIQLEEAGWTGVVPPDYNPLAGDITIANSAANQREHWSCGVHAVLNGWCYALGVPPTATGVRLGGNFARDAVQLINLALQGFMDAATIEAFLRCYRFIPSDRRVGSNRMFDRTIPFRDIEDFQEHVAAERLTEELRQRRVDQEATGDEGAPVPSFEGAMEVMGLVEPFMAGTRPDRLRLVRTDDFLRQYREAQLMLPLFGLQPNAQAATQNNAAGPDAAANASPTLSEVELQQALAASLEDATGNAAGTGDSGAQESSTEPAQQNTGTSSSATDNAPAAQSNDGVQPEPTAEPSDLLANQQTQNEVNNYGGRGSPPSGTAGSPTETTATTPAAEISTEIAASSKTPAEPGAADQASTGPAAPEQQNADMSQSATSDKPSDLEPAGESLDPASAGLPDEGAHEEEAAEAEAGGPSPPDSLFDGKADVEDDDGYEEGSEVLADEEDYDGEGDFVDEENFDDGHRDDADEDDEETGLGLEDIVGEGVDADENDHDEGTGFEVDEIVGDGSQASEEEHAALGEAGNAATTEGSQVLDIDYGYDVPLDEDEW